MRILVTVKLVPDTNADKRIDPTAKRLVRTGVETVLNPFDEYALEAALQLRDKLGDGTTVTAFSMAPESGKEILRKALAMGADDGILLADPALEGSDVWGTASAIAAAVKPGAYDLILTGTQSTDATTGDVPGMLAELLDIPGLTYVRKLELEGRSLRAERETETGYQVVHVDLPALVSVTKSINQPRYPSLKGIMGAKKKELRVLRVSDVGLEGPVGTAGAKTEVLALAAPAARGKGHVATASDPVEGARIIVDFLREKKLL